MGFNSPESNFQPSCPQFSQNSFPNFGSHTPFPFPPPEEKSGLERSIEESLQQMQNLLNSQYQTPHITFLEHPIKEESELDKRLEVFCERVQRFQNMLDSSSQLNFQESYSSFQSHRFKMKSHQC